ncbi:M10 family metallopeptidase [Microvirga antarctica]|uniref:M10 family metallopeptidase n=1 Tax=Microvirga antarctica TaxID=2819233 RepID=UPI001B30A74C|nr:M10 family metallopeptidase [Microvirga antarctica]
MATVREIPGKGYGNVFIDSLIWGAEKWANPSADPVTYFFGSRRDFKVAAEIHPGGNKVHEGRVFFDELNKMASKWKQTEKQAFASALSLYESVCGLKFTPSTSPQHTNIAWWQTALGDDILGAHETPAAEQSWGIFNQYDPTWKNLKPGSSGFYTILHELGHGMGLAHPHDGGGSGDSTRFPGVYDAEDKGTGHVNQGVFTVMSYNRAWDHAPKTKSYGQMASLGALDIAALQTLYGANKHTQTSDNLYALPKVSRPGATWSCIWDAAGNDTITGAGSGVGVTIDLRGATLRPGDEHAGGFISQAKGIAGGFTIAHRVRIENAIGSKLKDVLTGNAVANKLLGHAGSDTLEGFGGNDYLDGGAGSDRLSGGFGADTFAFTTRLKTGEIESISDFKPGTDTMSLAHQVFDRIGHRGVLQWDAFVSGSQAHDAHDRILYDEQTGLLSYDPDGSGAMAAHVIAQLSTGLRLSHTDFLVS